MNIILHEKEGYTEGDMRVSVSEAIDALKSNSVAKLRTGYLPEDYEAVIDAIGPHSTLLTTVMLGMYHAEHDVSTRGRLAIKLIRRAPKLRNLCADLMMDTHGSMLEFFEQLQKCQKIPHTIHLITECLEPYPAAIVGLIRNKRCPQRLYIHWVGPVSFDWEILVAPLRDNWEVIEICPGTACSICYKDTFKKFIYPQIEGLLQRNNALRWVNQNSLILNYCIAIAPIGISPYELLWILDWIPPFHHRFTQGDEQNGKMILDPFHYRKIRLIERVCKSVRNIAQ